MDERVLKRHLFAHLIVSFSRLAAHPFDHGTHTVQYLLHLLFVELRGGVAKGEQQGGGDGRGGRSSRGGGVRKGEWCEHRRGWIDDM